MTATRIETPEAMIVSHIDTASVPEWQRKAIALRFLRRFDAWENENKEEQNGKEEVCAE